MAKVDITSLILLTGIKPTGYTVVHNLPREEFTCSVPNVGIGNAIVRALRARAAEAEHTASKVPAGVEPAPAPAAPDEVGVPAGERPELTPIQDMTRAELEDLVADYEAGLDLGPNPVDACLSMIRDGISDALHTGRPEDISAEIRNDLAMLLWTATYALAKRRLDLAKRRDKG